MMLNNMAPLWDEAIAGLLMDDHREKARPLDIVDLQALAVENATRIGDIMETLFLMAIYGDWTYSDGNGAKSLDQSALDDLYSRGRVSAEDLSSFDGVWQPS